MHTIKLSPSLWLAGMLTAMHGMALTLIWLLPFNLWLKIVAVLLLLASLIYHVRRDAMRTSRNAILALKISPECRCSVQVRSGDWFEAQLLSTSFVSHYLTILNLRFDHVRLVKHVVILPDAIEAEQFRQLRVLLRWRCGKELARPSSASIK